MDIRVLLADDHLIVRQGCKALLEREGFEVVGEASDGHEAVRLSRTLQPDVAVLDLAMPLMNGLEASQEIVHVSPRTKSVLLTMYTDDHYVIQALRAGIQGYVVKTQATTDLVQAIHEVTKGAIYLSPTISRAVVDAYLAKTELPPDPLTPRERQVLQLVAEGKTAKEMAEFLGISVKTVESHRTRIKEKLHIHDTAGLVRYAIRQGVIQP
ncbi:MAG: DNA-binding response regulator [Candidatus Methylomirabilota bacterium]|nr:response regulator transcription factor [candidate division NC10 bacterium]PWB42962.1 MAG: DNA-binding response regulator [candidate division NC10 bacterium]